MACLDRSFSRSLAVLRYGAGLAVFCACLALLPTPAGAAEPRQPTEPNVLSDTAVDLLDVPDAFDTGDPFDVTMRLAFDHEQRDAAITREAASGAAGGAYGERLLVGSYAESTERLVPELAIGILRDFALHVRLPIILANDRALREAGSPPSNAALAGLPGETLFAVPFDAPTRSGIEYLAVGMNLGLMNQFRNPALPNWVVGIEGRINVSEPMHACNARPPAGQVSCAYPADIDRDGVADALGPAYSAPLAGGGNLSQEPEGDFSGSRGPGVSRGTHGLEAHAYVSRRLRYIEPYTGISGLAEFQTPDSDYGPSSFFGTLNNHPPLRGGVIAGVAVIPWEQPDRYSRISIDLRVEGYYVSEGRGYSELFDALGSSSAPSIRSPNFEGYRQNVPADPATPSVVDPNSDRVNFTGITDIQQHGDYKFRARFTWQAGQYVRFDVGGALRVIQGHLITFDQACRPDPLVSLAHAGPCKVDTGSTDQNGDPTFDPTGAPNPAYRTVLNAPGRRYYAETSIGWNLWLRASVLF